MSQSRVQEEAAVKVQAMLFDSIKNASADLGRLLDTAKIVSDPAKGNNLDLFI